MSGCPPPLRTPHLPIEIKNRLYVKDNLIYICNYSSISKRRTLENKKKYYLHINFDSLLVCNKISKVVNIFLHTKAVPKRITENLIETYPDLNGYLNKKYTVFNNIEIS